MAEHLIIRLDQLQPLLPWSPQTLWNKRSSGDSDKGKSLCWLIRISEKRRLWVDVELLNSYLLARGLQEVALEVLIRVHQVQQYGNVFRGQRLSCSFGILGCSGGQCDGCMAFRFRFRRSPLMTPAWLRSMHPSVTGAIPELRTLSGPEPIPQPRVRSSKSLRSR